MSTCQSNVAEGRRARLQASPREGPESAPKPSFHCEREIGFTARSGPTPNAPSAPAPRRSPAFPVSGKSLRARARGRRALRQGGRSIGRAWRVQAPLAGRDCASKPRVGSSSLSGRASYFNNLRDSRLAATSEPDIDRTRRANRVRLSREERCPGALEARMVYTNRQRQGPRRVRHDVSASPGKRRSLFIRPVLSQE